MSEPDFAKAASGPQQPYDVSPGGLGLNPAYLASATATATSSTASNVGWTVISDTFTYSSADGPTFVMTSVVDQSGTIGVGTRIKLTQSATVKYFIVTKISGVTITLYGGTDYTLANASISDVYYSLAKGPYGFPLDQSKWTETLKDTSNRTQVNPTANTWYNPGSLSISLPIGSWDVRWQAFVDVDYQSVPGGNVTRNVYATLSTSNNSESDSDLTAGLDETLTESASTNVSHTWSLSKRKTLVVTVKTAYFLNVRTKIGSQNNVAFYGLTIPTLVNAICAYL